MKDYSSYVALVVATETEEKAIKNMYDWKPVTFSDDTQTYYSASILYFSSYVFIFKRASSSFTFVSYIFKFAFPTILISHLICIIMMFFLYFCHK